MANEFTALKDIQAPGTTVFGYRRGDPVRADVVENWGLTLDDDVCEGNLPNDAPVTPAAVRPDEGANRATWEAWAVANGMSAEDAADAPMDDLQAAGPQEPGERPADSAKKADWAAYVVAQGADEDWANATGRTKADLQAWTPTPGDPVAAAAGEAQA